MREYPRLEEQGIAVNSQPVASYAASRSTFLWACVGFGIPYVAFFLVPTFFSGPAMLRPEPLPLVTPIAADLRALVEFGRLWLEGHSPYEGGNSLYPPLANLLFAALYEIGFVPAFVVMTFITIGLFLFMMLTFCLRLDNNRRVSPLLALFVVTGLTSYGMQFELERGQFNVLAMGLSFSGVWIFHKRPKWTLLAYSLFSAGIHLKLYPAILGLLLTHDYRDIWGNLRKAAGLAAVNFLLLFVAGPQMYADFFVWMDTLAFKFGGWMVNHSIYSFAVFTRETLSRHMILPVHFEGAVEGALLSLLIGCIVAILAFNRRDNQFGLDPYLLLACTIGALLIPPISYDYKLTLLALPMALTAMEFEKNLTPQWFPRTGVIVLALMVAAYSSTLYSYALKPTVFDSNCPALFVMLICVTVLTAMRSRARSLAEPIVAAA